MEEQLYEINTLAEAAEELMLRGEEKGKDWRPAVMILVHEIKQRSVLLPSSNQQ